MVQAAVYVPLAVSIRKVCRNPRTHPIPLGKLDLEPEVCHNKVPAGPPSAGPSFRASKSSCSTCTEVVSPLVGGFRALLPLFRSGDKKYALAGTILGSCQRTMAYFRVLSPVLLGNFAFKIEIERQPPAGLQAKLPPQKPEALSSLALAELWMMAAGWLDDDVNCGAGGGP